MKGEQDGIDGHVDITWRSHNMQVDGREDGETGIVRVRAGFRNA